MAAETYADYLARQAERDNLGQATVGEDYWTRAQRAMADRQAIEGVAQYQDQQAQPFQDLLTGNAANLDALEALKPGEQAAYSRRFYEPASRAIDARAAAGARMTDAPSWYVPPALQGTVQAGQATGELNYGGTGQLQFQAGGAVKGAKVLSELAENRNFTKWFGGSKITLPDGAPRQVFHGTDRDIEAFKPNKPTDKDVGWYGKGIYTTADPSSASAYSEYARLQSKTATQGPPRVMPLFASLKNPYVWPEGRPIAMTADEAAKITAELKAAGYDGVVVANKHADSQYAPHYEVIAFEPTQLKSSTGNRGTFDAADSRLNYADGGPVPQAEAGPYDARAHAAWTSPSNDKPEPSEAQRKAGNYGKGHAYVNGMRLSIENPQGSIRRGTGRDGTDWASPLFSHYGYIRGTTGRDKDHIDAFLGPLAGDGELPVFVVDQLDPETGAFDEHKVMLGYADEDAARAAYMMNYPDDWAGLGAVTAMPLRAFKKWAFQPGRRVKALGAEVQHYAKGGSVCDCEASPEAQGAYAEGGPVSAEDEAKPYFGNPNLARQGKRAKVAARSNTLNDPLTALVRGLLGELPDEYGSVLDPNRAANIGAGEVGYGLGTAALAPILARPLIKGAKGALTMMAESAGAARPAGVKRGQTGVNLLKREGDDELLREFMDTQYGGVDDATRSSVERLHMRPPKRELGAVKLPGGNWLPEPKDILQEYGRNAGPAVQSWRDKQLAKYIKNYLGTAQDPLIKLEREGRLHMAPEDLRNVQTPLRPDFHEAETGRATVSPWESTSDYAIDRSDAGVLAYRLGDEAPSWMKKQPADAQVYSSADMFEGLGFDHLLDYLDAATRAHGAGAADPLVARGLAIDPAKLDRMSVPDVVAKVSDWNKMLAEAKALKGMNEGVKSVLKAYPESGHQWVELAPEGLQAEGAAMRHCVGGYCSSVEDGSTRILSLRDKDGKPAVTVELRPGADWNTQPGWFDARPDLEQPWRQYYQEAGGNATPKTIQGFPGWLEKAQPGLFAKYSDDFKPAPAEVRQIKGPANRPPSKDVLPMVQDLVRNMGPWGRVGDLQNTGLRQAHKAVELGEGLPQLPAGFYSPEHVTSWLRENGLAGTVDPADVMEALEQQLTRTGQRGLYAEGGAVEEQLTARPEWADKLDAILAANSGDPEEGARNSYQYIDDAGKVYTPASYGYVSVDESDPRQQHETKIANDYDSTGANLGEREYEHKGGFSGFWEDSGPALMMMLTPMLGAAGFSMTGALSNGIASATGLSPGVAGALSQAITSGVQAELGGGDFLKGAASGAVGSFMPSVGNATADAALRSGTKALIGGGDPLRAALMGAVGKEYGPLGSAAMQLAQGRIPVRELVAAAARQGEQ